MTKRGLEKLVEDIKTSAGARTISMTEEQFKKVKELGVLEQDDWDNSVSTMEVEAMDKRKKEEIERTKMFTAMTNMHWGYDDETLEQFKVRTWRGTHAKKASDMLSKGVFKGL
jgi:hypothetical protein